MPQYEFDAVGPIGFSGRARGRTPVEAVRHAAELGEDVAVSVADEADLHGWCAVAVDGEASGRVRLHQRMQFRRD